MRWVRGADLQYNQVPYPSGNPQRRIITLQKFSHRSKSSELQVRLPIMGIWHLKGEHLEHLAFHFWSSTGLRETETPLLEGAYKVSHAPEPRAEAVTS